MAYASINYINSTHNKSILTNIIANMENKYDKIPYTVSKVHSFFRDYGKVCHFVGSLLQGTASSNGYFINNLSSWGLHWLLSKCIAVLTMEHLWPE